MRKTRGQDHGYTGVPRGCYTSKYASHLKANLMLLSETVWDLGPGTLCCSACTWTNVSSSNKIQRNYKGLKITVCMHSWDKLWKTRYKKTKNPTATSEVWGAKAGYCACILHTAPPRGWAEHLSHPPSRPLDLTPFKGPAHHPLRSEQGHLLLVFTPSCTSPSKALPEFLVWTRNQFPLINESKNPGQ